MNPRKLFSRTVPISICFLFVSIGTISVWGQHPEPQPYRSPFRFIIAYDDPWSDGDSSHRMLTVLMRPEDFTEENLRYLDSFIRQRLKGSKKFVVRVETSLFDVDTPDERAQAGRESEQDSKDPNVGESPYALIYHVPAIGNSPPVNELMMNWPNRTSKTIDLPKL